MKNLCRFLEKIIFRGVKNIPLSGIERETMILNKYRNKKTVINGIKFDSKKEGSRFLELKYLERSGLITDLKTQVTFVLIEKSQYGRQIVYKADFTYTEDGKLVVEDVKSTATKTPVYRLKKRLMAERYGIIIKEV